MKMFCTCLVAFLLLSGFSDDNKTTPNSTTTKQKTTVKAAKQTLPSLPKNNKPIKLTDKSRDEDVGKRQDKNGTNFVSSRDEDVN